MVLLVWIMPQMQAHYAISCSGQKSHKSSLIGHRNEMNDDFGMNHALDTGSWCYKGLFKICSINHKKVTAVHHFVTEMKWIVFYAWICAVRLYWARNNLSFRQLDDFGMYHAPDAGSLCHNDLSNITYSDISQHCLLFLS